MKLSFSPSVKVSQVTGAKTAKWGMGGGDLGVMWNNGNTVYHVFGDNFKTVSPPPDGGPGATTDWRPNAIGRSTNADLTNGVKFDNFNVDSAGDRTAILDTVGTDDGCVPTGGIHVGKYDICAYQSFPHAHADFNYTRVGGTAYSVNGGNFWYLSSCCWNQNAALTDPFQQSAFASSGDGYTYRFTTESGRLGNIHLLRCPDAGIITKSAYQYWTGSAWSSDQTQVGVLIPGPAGEMSARYDALLSMWYVMYHNDSAGATMLRYAPAPTGPWSAEQRVLEDSVENVYAPELHPKSAGTDLWWCGSLWGTYEVYLYSSKISVSC